MVRNAFNGQSLISEIANAPEPLSVQAAYARSVFESHFSETPSVSADATSEFTFK